MEGGLFVRCGFCGEGLGQHEGLLEGVEVVVILSHQFYEATAEGARDGIFGIEEFFVVIVVEGRAHDAQPHAGGDGASEGGVFVAHDPGRKLFEAIGGGLLGVEAYFPTEGGSPFHQLAGVAVRVLVIIGELDAS